MNILYIILDYKAVAPIDGMNHVMSVTYDVSNEKGSNYIPWHSNRNHSLFPIDYFINFAQKNQWMTLAKPILSKHGAGLVWDDVLEKGPRWFAGINLEQFYQSEFATDRNQPTALIARDLKHLAIEIVERKTAFVFPTKWSESITKAATDMLSLMVKELAVLLREMPTDQELAITFLSRSCDSNGKNVLGEFIRCLHSELLTHKNSLDILSWTQKSGAILLSGPTGSGKSYAAKLLAADKKYKSRLVEVNLAAVLEEQLESRMRGFKSGTFTGGDKHGRAGWFEDANDGVLFFDEFQSISMAAQVQLLDVLNAVSDDVYIARTGEDHDRKRFNVKVVLAINEDLDTLLREKRLRKDIYYRVRLIESFPSLKERLDQDFEYRYLRGLLATYRWKSLRTLDQFLCLEGGWCDMEQTFFPVFSQEALSELAIQEWEGNFRELERVAFDLFYGCDYQQLSQYFDKNRIVNSVKSWNLQIDGNLEKNSKTEGMTNVEQQKLNDIQQALRKSGFVIASVLKKQPYYRSRSPLKTYLRNHIDKLDKDIRSDSRMVRFLS